MTELAKYQDKSNKNCKTKYYSVCPRCRSRFKKRKSYQKFCSADCQEHKSPIVCNCVKCGTEFVANHKRKYCSDECNPHVRIWDRSNRKCEKCGKEYNPRVRTQRFCGKACKPHYIGKSDPFYQSKEWKRLRAEFVEANPHCVKCLNKGKVTPVFAVDHIIRIKDGGSRTAWMNLQSLCRYHHQSKSAIEGNQQRLKVLA